MTELHGDLFVLGEAPKQLLHLDPNSWTKRNIGRCATNYGHHFYETINSRDAVWTMCQIEELYDAGPRKSKILG